MGQHSPRRRSGPAHGAKVRQHSLGAPQGEALATWLLWALLLGAITVTYARVSPGELYHVSREGLDGGLSRTLVALNFPVSLVAILLVLVALDALPRRAWWAGGPAIALCAVTAWPGVVDKGDLDARLVNVVPALGVMLAVGLTVAATRRAGTDVAPRRALDGALLAITGLLLCRPRLASPRLTIATTLYVSLMCAYGLVNLVQDLWGEQVAKRGWSDRRMPSALEPSLTPIWLVTLGIAGPVALFLLHETHSDAKRGSRATAQRRAAQPPTTPGPQGSAPDGSGTPPTGGGSSTAPRRPR